MTNRNELTREIRKMERRLALLKTRVETLPPGGLFGYESELKKDLEVASETIYEWNVALTA